MECYQCLKQGQRGTYSGIHWYCYKCFNRYIVGIPMKDEQQKALDTQEGGSHYKNMAIQPIEYIVKNNIEYMPGNIIKYASRYKTKNGADDVRKIIHYCKLILELEYGESSE